VSEEPKPYRTRVEDVPLVEGLTREDGWIDMQVRFLIDEASCGSDKLTFGWTVMKPGASHEKHRHFHCDEFLVVMSGSGIIFTDEEEEPATKGDVVFTPRGHWHGFRNTSNEEALLVWGWSGAGSLQAAGYEVGH
jgi:mannose-6-phosphate isomerase-like protein (cupin superfamily)